ncbi:MAG TPA: lysylphosphatidylglycerol synthase transmembrane domain-containing protein [Gemmatimonadaceae bacterium]|nr:lysylphosphatidylglycerol synthase transmembrane domain-containing protein [Gemmatimonadaceae bacterium]
MKRHLQALAWVGATVLLLFMISRVDAVQLRAAAAAAHWSWIPVAVLANAMILVSWTALWWRVAPDAERPAYRVMFEINAMASALMNTVPFLGGHAAAVVLMVKRAAMSRAGALSVMALDQLGEGLSKVILFLVVALFAPIPGWMRLGVITVCAAVGALLIGMVVAAHGHRYIRPRESEPLTHVKRLRILAAHWAERMETLRSVKRSLIALSFALGTKVAEGAGLLAVQYAFGVDLPPGSTALVLAAVTLGAMLPIAPGNIGTYEAAAIIAYRHLGIDPGMATILAVASHVCFMIPSVGIGYMLGSWKVRNAVVA